MLSRPIRRTINSASASACCRCFHGVERLGQSFYEYGIKSEIHNIPFVRLPVPLNPKPLPVTYTAFCRVLEAMQRDLEKAEATLAEVKDDNVKLPLRLAAIRFDFTGDGKAADTFLVVMKKIMRTDFEFLAANPEFLVKFDRGDVAWLRAYCHLLAGMLDLYLAIDLEDAFDRFGSGSFAEPKRRKAGDLDPIKMGPFAVQEPARLGHFRKHMLAVCQLNRETWKYIRAETGDDHEWLPNAKQTSVFSLTVTDEQIDAWLKMMEEFEVLLEGKKVIPQSILAFVWPNVQGGLNLKDLLDDPPEKFDFEAIKQNGPTAKYIDKRKGVDLDFGAILNTGQVFNNPLGVGYMLWFN